MKYCNADLEYGNIIWYLDTETKNIIWAVDGEDNKEYYSYLGIKEGALAYPQHLNHYDMWFTNNFPFPQVKGFVKLYQDNEECFVFKIADIESDFSKWKKKILAGRISSDGDVLTSFSGVPENKKDLRCAVNFFLKKSLINENTSLYWNEEFQGPTSYILGGTEMLSNISNDVEEQTEKTVTAQAEVTLDGGVPEDVGPSNEDPQVISLVERYKNGDREAGETILEKYDKMIRGIWYSYLRKFNLKPDNHKAEDALQEAYMYFLDRLKEYDPAKAKLSTFIFKNTDGVIRNFFNPQRNKEDLLEIDTPNNKEPLSDRNDDRETLTLDQMHAPVEKDEAGHIAERAEAIISQYPEREQTMVKDFFYNKKTLQQIGDDFQVSRERIRQIIEQVILRIRRDPKVREHAPDTDTEKVKLGMIFKDDCEPTSNLCNKA